MILNMNGNIVVFRLTRMILYNLLTFEAASAQVILAQYADSPGLEQIGSRIKFIHKAQVAEIN